MEEVDQQPFLDADAIDGQRDHARQFDQREKGKEEIERNGMLKGERGGVVGQQDNGLEQNAV